MAKILITSLSLLFGGANPTRRLDAEFAPLITFLRGSGAVPLPAADLFASLFNSPTRANEVKKAIQESPDRSSALEALRLGLKVGSLPSRTAPGVTPSGLTPTEEGRFGIFANALFAEFIDGVTAEIAPLQARRANLKKLSEG